MNNRIKTPPGSHSSGGPFPGTCKKYKSRNTVLLTTRKSPFPVLLYDIEKHPSIHKRSNEKQCTCTCCISIVKKISDCFSSILDQQAILQRTAPCVLKGGHAVRLAQLVDVCAGAGAWVRLSFVRLSPAYNLKLTHELSALKSALFKTLFQSFRFKNYRGKEQEIDAITQCQTQSRKARNFREIMNKHDSCISIAALFTFGYPAVWYVRDSKHQ